MELPRHQSSFLLTQFREFYREVARLKTMVAVHTPLSSAEETVEAGTLTAAAAAAGSGRSLVAAETIRTGLEERAPSYSDMVSRQLISLLERQALDASQSGGAFAYEVYREAQYVMAALADEIFLHSEWQGREDWRLIESRLFQSHYAGEEIFERLDRLLRRSDPFYIDLASVYFMALSLGFQGKYRGHPPMRLEQYRQQLFSMIYRRKPKLFDNTTQIFPQSYQNTLDKVAPKRLPAQWVWLWLVGVVLTVWIGVGALMWRSATTDLNCLICSLLSRGCICSVETTGAPPPPAPAAHPATPKGGTR